MSGGPVIDAEGRCLGLFQGILPPPPRARAEGGRWKRHCNDLGEGQCGDVDAVLQPLQKSGGWKMHAAFIPMAPVLEFASEKGLFSA